MGLMKSLDKRKLSGENTGATMYILITISIALAVFIRLPNFYQHCLLNTIFGLF